MQALSIIQLDKLNQEEKPRENVVRKKTELKMQPNTEFLCVVFLRKNAFFSSQFWSQSYKRNIFKKRLSLSKIL